MRIELEIEYTDAELQDMINKELSAIEGISFDKVEQDGFDGLDILLYFIAMGGAVSVAAVIKDISKVIMKIISRNDAKVVKVGNIEVKGYGEKDVEKLLEKIVNVPANKHK